MIVPSEKTREIIQEAMRILLEEQCLKQPATKYLIATIIADENGSHTILSNSSAPIEVLREFLHGILCGEVTMTELKGDSDERSH